MSERRRLKAGVEVGRNVYGWYLMHRSSGGWRVAISDYDMNQITEPIPEEPAEPKVGDEVTAEEPESVSRQAVLADTGAHMSDFIDRRIANMERIWTATMEDLAVRIEALEKVNPNPKEVMPDAGGSRTDDAPTRDVAPPPGAEQDAPGGDEPSVEEVLEWLEERARWWTVPLSPPAAAARIIRELGEEIEEWSSLYRRTHGKMAELRAEVASLTERLTITDEKVEAAARRVAQVRWGAGSWDKVSSESKHFALADAHLSLRAAGMIDPEVEG